MSETHLNFHGVETEPATAREASFHVIPVPYERTTSYGKGAVSGPRAILTASQYLEPYDGVGVPAEAGIYTHPPVPCEGEEETVLEAIAACVSSAVDHESIPVLLGGEHTVSVGAVRGLKRCGQRFGVVQFDAHDDLRDTYQGSSLSHGCALRRVIDMDVRLFQIGVRSLSLEAIKVRKEKGIGYLDAVDIVHNGFAERILPKDFPQDIYITFDLDAFDPSIMPSTGTPEPGGLGWYQVMAALERICSRRNVVGFDVVELAPIEGMHAPDFTAARLIYNLMGFIVRS